MLKTIYARFDCEVYRVDLFVIFGESIAECEKELIKRTGFGTGEDDLTEWQAGYVQRGSIFSILLMPSDRLLRNIHHESCHIAMSILNRAGIPHTLETDEAFCYLSDWVFGKTVDFLKKKGVEVC